MAQNQEGGSTATEKQVSGASFENLLAKLLKRPVGLRIRIEGEEEPYKLTGKVLNLRVGSAWIMFSYDDVVIRTKRFEDRNKFYERIISGRDDILDVQFYLPAGGKLKRAPVYDVTASEPRAFKPRAQRHYNKQTVGARVPKDLLTTEE